MAVVEYKVPQSLDEAVSLLSKGGENAKILAGGTDLIIQSRARDAKPLTVIDLKKVAGMKEATLDALGLSLGPCMPCAEFTARADINALFPGLVEGAYLIGSTQVQGRCSIGGNLCNASPAADTIPSLIVNQARCVIQGPTGERSVAAEDFITGVAQNCLQTGELLKRIRVPNPSARTSDAYLRFIPRTEMDIAVAGAAVSITLDASGFCVAARVAIGAVAVTAILVPEAAAALVGTKVTDEALKMAADAASAASKPITDRRGTAEFRRHVVGVLTKRAAKIAVDRTKEK